MKCNKCGKTLFQCSGWLERVNEKGVDGIFECRPSCEAHLSEESAVIGAITGEALNYQPTQDETGEWS